MLTRRLILSPAAWVALLLLVSACNLNSTPQIIPSATPELPTTTPTEVVTPTNTPTPAPPTATPPPTVVPQVALSTASRDLLNGVYEKAVTEYQQVVVQGSAAPQDALSAAALGVGQAAVREGLFAEAVDALTVLIDRLPDDANVGRAHFLRGEAYLGLSRWNEAIADYQAYLALNPGLIDSTVYTRIGDAQLGRGAQGDALNAYTTAINATRSLTAQLWLRERLAQLLTVRGEHMQALEQYDAITASAQGTAVRAQSELRAAEALQAADEIERSTSRLRRVFDQYPSQPEAYVAMQRLVNEGYDLDLQAMARVAFNYGDYETTVRLLTEYTSGYELAAVPAELYMLLGRAYRELGSFDAAVVAFQTVVEQYPRDPLFGEALLEQGQTRLRADDFGGAMALYTRIVMSYGYLPEAPEALWQIGYLYATNGQPAEARSSFEKLAQDYPNSFQARSGLFLAASAAMASGDLATAERLYGLLAVSSSGDEQAAAYLNAGRLAQQRGNTRFATDSLTSAVNAAPDSYYAARAQDLVSARAPFAPPAQVQLEFDEDADIAAAESWLRERFGLAGSGPLAPLPDALANDDRLIAGHELWLLAAYEEARIEFGDLLATYQNDGVASYQLAMFLRGIGAYSDSIVAIANVLRAAGAGTLDAPPFIARMRYPIYYADVVQDVAAEADIDPLLVFALIRHESLFDTTLVSPSGEVGLMQLSPGAVAYAAERLGTADYRLSEMDRPVMGIRYGVALLDAQLEQLDGNVLAALAAYEAGMQQARTWLELSGGDADLYMTTITQEPTRAYIQRIYSYYNIYRALYGDAAAQP